MTLADSDSKKEQLIKRAIRVGSLMDLYGPLLTDRQREFIRLHYLEDLSFGEIAKEYGVSRQAVHDAVKHGENSLNEYDAKLKLSPEMVQARLAQKDSDTPGTASAPSEAPASQSAPAADLTPTVAELQNLHDRIVRSGGVIYNGNEIATELAQVIQRLKAL